MVENNPIEIHLFAPGFEEFFVRYGQQIAKGEIFVETEELLPKDTAVQLVFQIIYEELELIRAKGKVVSAVKPEGADIGTGASGKTISRRGMNIKIEDIDETFKAYLVELIKRQIRTDLSRMFTT